jgi:hypothetical protein
MESVALRRAVVVVVVAAAVVEVVVVVVVHRRSEAPEPDQARPSKPPRETAGRTTTGPANPTPHRWSKVRCRTS